MAASPLVLKYALQASNYLQSRQTSGMDPCLLCHLEVSLPSGWMAA